MRYGGDVRIRDAVFRVALIRDRSECPASLLTLGVVGAIWGSSTAMVVGV